MNIQARTALSFLVASLGACGGGAPGVQGAGSRPPKPVKLIVVGTAELPDKVAVSGVLAAQEELVLGLEVAGRLATLAVDVGDVVPAGTPIASLAPREFELAVNRAKAAIVAAEARLGWAGKTELDEPGYEAFVGAFDVEAVPAIQEARAIVGEATLHRDRVATMVQEKMQPGSELETAAAALAVAESRLQRARDEVRTWIADARLRRVELLQAQKRLADSSIKAPWLGRVAMRHVTAGQVVAAGAPVVTLLRTDPLRLRLRVPDRQAMGVRPGQSVEFTVDGADATLHQGRVVRTGPAIDRGDRTRLVEAEVANPEGLLLPGAFCRASIVVAPAVAAAVVPRSAVVTFAGVDRVFTVATDPAGQARAKGQIVELGRTLGDQVEVRRGVTAGARIVRDAAGLTPELPVAVVE